MLIVPELQLVTAEKYAKSFPSCNAQKWQTLFC